MLENLFNLVKQYAGDDIINNPSIPNERNDEAVSGVADSIAGGLQGALASGNIKDILSMFSSNQDVAQSNVAQNIQGGFIDNLVGKFGLDRGQAGGIAASLIPMVLQNLVSKTNDPNDNSFDLQGILNNFSGGKTSGFDISGLMNKFKGGAFDRDGDGDTDLQDIAAMLKGGGVSGGGVMDAVKGLFN